MATSNRIASSPVRSPDRWTDLRAKRLVSIPRLHRLASPLQPSHSQSPCPILCLMPHSLAPPNPSPALPFFLHLSQSFSSYKSSFSLCFMQRLPSNLPILSSFLLSAPSFVSSSLGLSPSSFYLPVSHYIPYLSLSLLLPPPTLSSSVPKASGSQQWIITHLRNSASSVLLVQLVVRLSINQSVGTSTGKIILAIPHA